MEPHLLNSSVRFLELSSRACFLIAQELLFDRMGGAEDLPTPNRDEYRTKAACAFLQAALAMDARDYQAEVQVEAFKLQREAMELAALKTVGEGGQTPN